VVMRRPTMSCRCCAALALSWSVHERVVVAGRELGLEAVPTLVPTPVPAPAPATGPAPAPAVLIALEQFP